MSNAVQETPGKTRACPHCRATILDSASICPACRHYLRSDVRAAQRALPSFAPLQIEGTIRHPDSGEPWEYSVLLTIHDERGKELSRHVVGIGALHPTEQRTFVLGVEVFTPAGAAADDAVVSQTSK